MLIIEESIIENGKYEEKRIDELYISNKVKVIGDFAFFKTSIEMVVIPNSIESIGKYAFDYNTKITYKGYIFSSPILKQYGTENIMKIVQILEIMSKTITLKNINYFFSKEILENIIINSDNVRSYITNFHLFNRCVDNLIETLKTENIIGNSGNMYKLFYIFGFFNSSNKEDIYNNILKFLKSNNIYKVFETMDTLEIKDYNKKLAIILNEESSNKQLLELLLKTYDDFNLIILEIKERKKQQLKKIDAEYKRSKSKDIKEQYQILKKDKRKITLYDMLNYIKLKTYLEEDSVFSSIAPFLYRTICEEEIARMYDIYKNSLKLTDNQYLESYTVNKPYINFSWIKNSDLLNFTLGYICDCCAKIGDEGEFIINQSMTNPYVKNLVIFDLKNEVLAKTTAIYQLKYKAIIFNGIMMPKSLRKNAYIKSIILETIIEAIKSQLILMEEKGIEIRQVLMESFDNNLNDLLINYPLSESIYDNILRDKVKQNQYVFYRK